jgi:dTDP-4-amino-4,6-dideoxygalactose transaminase
MMDVQAAIGLHQLSAIAERAARREAIWRAYDDAFADLPLAGFDPVPGDSRHARHLYTVLVTPESGTTRDEVARALARDGIASSVHFPVVHLHRYYADRFGFRRGQFPHAERIADSVLSLPFSPALDDEQIARVIRSVRKACGA